MLAWLFAFLTLVTTGAMHVMPADSIGGPPGKRCAAVDRLSSSIVSLNAPDSIGGPPGRKK